MIICPRCSAQLPDSSTSCSNCGVPFIVQPETNANGHMILNQQMRPEIDRQISDESECKKKKKPKKFILFLILFFVVFVILYIFRFYIIDFISNEIFTPLYTDTKGPSEFIIDDFETATEENKGFIVTESDLISLNDFATAFFTIPYYHIPEFSETDESGKTGISVVFNKEKTSDKELFEIMYSSGTVLLYKNYFGDIECKTISDGNMDPLNLFTDIIDDEINEYREYLVLPKKNFDEFSGALFGRTLKFNEDEMISGEGYTVYLHEDNYYIGVLTSSKSYPDDLITEIVEYRQHENDHYLVVISVQGMFGDIDYGKFIYTVSPTELNGKRIWTVIKIEQFSDEVYMEGA